MHRLGNVLTNVREILSRNLVGDSGPDIDQSMELLHQILHESYYQIEVMDNKSLFKILISKLDNAGSVTWYCTITSLSFDILDLLCRFLFLFLFLTDWTFTEFPFVFIWPPFFPQVSVMPACKGPVHLVKRQPPIMPHIKIIPGLSMATFCLIFCMF